MQNGIIYPPDAFQLEARRVAGKEHTGGWENFSPHILLKAVFPVFAETSQALRYRLQVALVLQDTWPESDMASTVVPQITLRGVGAPRGVSASAPNEILQQGVEMAFESLSGVGGIPSAFRSLYRRTYKGVQQDAAHKGRMHIGEEAYGRFSMNVSVFDSPGFLARNGFRGHDVSDGSMAILIDSAFAWTRAKIEKILAQRSNVPAKYGSARLVFRLHVPEDELVHCGRDPKARVLWNHSSQEGTQEAQEERGELEIPVAPIVYLKETL